MWYISNCIAKMICLSIVEIHSGGIILTDGGSFRPGRSSLFNNAIDVILDPRKHRRRGLSGPPWRPSGVVVSPAMSCPVLTFLTVFWNQTETIFNRSIIHCVTCLFVPSHHCIWVLQTPNKKFVFVQIICSDTGLNIILIPKQIFSSVWGRDKPLPVWTRADWPVRNSEMGWKP